MSLEPAPDRGEETVPTPAPPPLKPPREAVAEMRIRAPTRGNRRLEALLNAANADEQLKAWWHIQQVTAQRMGMSDHSWVHIQIVLNIGLRMYRLLQRRGIEGSVVADYGMRPRDAEVVIAAGALLHCIGMTIHRTRARVLLAVPGRRQAAAAAGRRSTRSRSARSSPPRRCTRSSATAATAGPSRSRPASCAWPTRSTWPRAARACEFEAGRIDIHSLSAAAIDEVRIEAGRGRRRSASRSP